MLLSFEYLGLSRQLTTICILSSVQTRYDLGQEKDFRRGNPCATLFHSALKWPHKKRAMEAVQAGRQAGRIRDVYLLRQRRAAQDLKPTRRNGSRSRTIRLRRIGTLTLNRRGRCQLATLYPDSPSQKFLVAYYGRKHDNNLEKSGTIASWCNGSTSDSGSLCHGSNPCEAAN